MRRVVQLLLLSVLPLSVCSQTHWTKNPDNPIMVPGSAGEWDETSVSYPQVIYYDSVYHMWYEGSRKDTTRIGHATSPDGITWTKDANNPVMDVGPDGAWDDHNAFSASVLLVDSVFHMWYNGQATSIGVAMNKIGHATSPDGISWTKDPNNPVLTNGPSGAWDDTWTYACNVAYANGAFHMWYSGYKDGVGQGIRIGHATSPDGVIWTKDPLNPVMTHSLDWEGKFIFPGGTFFDGSTFHMWYSGGNAWETKIGYATSEDGSQWEKNSEPLLRPGPAGSWESQFIGGASVSLDSTKNEYKMWYGGFSASGFDGGGGSIGYAESYEPAWKLMNNQDPGGMTCAVDSLFYSFSGGWEGWNIGNEAWSYNTSSNAWIRLPDMPIAMTEGGLGHVDGKIYLVGGWVQSATDDWMTVDSVLLYDIATGTYAFNKKCGAYFGSGADCVMDDRILLFGGHGKTYPKENHAFEAFAYDPVNEIWDDTFFPDMKFAHLMHGSAEVLDGKVYLIGGVGIGPDFELQRSECFNGESWEPIAEMPVPVTLHKSIVHKGRILVFGGDSLWTVQKSYSTNFIQEYDPDTDTWRMMEPMPFQRTAMEGDKIDNFMYLMGGSVDQRNPFSAYVTEVWRFNLDSLKEWEVACNEVLISESTLKLEIGHNSILSASVMPGYTADRTVSWSSSDEGVATVSADGEVSAVSEGEVTITATANGGGCTATCSVTVSSGVGFNMLKAGQISIYPNPVIDILEVATGLSEDHVIEVSSLNGQTIYNLTVERSSCSIDLSSLAKGVYFITIRSKDFVTTRKIIKL